MNIDERAQKKNEAVKVVCFTGHRNIPGGAAERLLVLLKETISELCERGATVFRAGGAMGFDTLAALAVLDMKETYPQLHLELILPCRNQTDGWNDVSRQVYDYILQRADEHRFLFDSYMEGCMLERDRKLVEGSDVCVAYCAQSQGGTAYTYTLALRADVETINLYDQLRDVEADMDEDVDMDEDADMDEDVDESMEDSADDFMDEDVDENAEE